MSQITSHFIPLTFTFQKLQKEEGGRKTINSGLNQMQQKNSSQPLFLLKNAKQRIYSLLPQWGCLLCISLSQLSQSPIDRRRHNFPQQNKIKLTFVCGFCLFSRQKLEIWGIISITFLGWLRNIALKSDWVSFCCNSSCLAYSLSLL